MINNPTHPELPLARPPIELMRIPNLLLILFILKLHFFQLWSQLFLSFSLYLWKGICEVALRLFGVLRSVFGGIVFLEEVVVEILMLGLNLFWANLVSFQRIFLFEIIFLEFMLLILLLSFLQLFLLPQFLMNFVSVLKELLRLFWHFYLMKI